MGLASDLAQRVVVIAGPTAVGKSELAMELATRIGGEIVSVDSMQVYRGMDLGTAKPSADERSNVPHHLVDVVSLTESFDAALFSQMAQPAIESIIARGKIPILCGGTGLYFKATLEGLHGGTGSDPELRKTLQAKSLAELTCELRRHDPDALSLVDCRNPRRVLRALEITLLSGEKYSSHRASRPRIRPLPVESSPWFGLHRTPEDLRRRIDDRVDWMFQHGLVEETAHLMALGLAQNQNAQQALGYRQVIDFLAGRASLPETIAQVKSRTRKYAKRQMTWFRYQMRLNWLDCEGDSCAERLLPRVLESVRPRFEG